MNFIRVSDIQTVFIRIVHNVLSVVFWVAGAWYFHGLLGNIAILLVLLSIIVEVLAKLPVWAPVFQKDDEDEEDE